jgi:histone deacetylase 1/2
MTCQAMIFDRDDNPDIPTLPIDAEMDDMNQDEDMLDPDERRPQRILDRRVQADGELSDSDDEGEGGRRDHASHRGSPSSNGSNSGGRKFGIGIGIMTAPAVSTHGAGPSGHMTLPPSGLGALDLDQGSSNGTPAQPSTGERGSPGYDEIKPDDLAVSDSRNGR